MKQSLVFLLFMSFIGVPAPYAQDFLTQLDFSAETSEENQVSVSGAGFDQYPQAEVSFGVIPVEAGFPEATDGQGIRIHAEPGEGVMLFTQTLHTSNCVLLRCSVRASASHVSLYIASMEPGEDQFVSTLTPNNPESFVGQYNRFANFFFPPSHEFQGIVQVINTSESDPLTVYIDNFEILESPPDKIEFEKRDFKHPQTTPTPTPTITPTPTPPEEEITVDLPELPSNATPLEMVYIESGSFRMGSLSNEQHRDEDEGPQHQVTLTQGFYMGKYEVTVGQYSAFLKARGDESGVDWQARDCPLAKQEEGYALHGTFGRSWDQPMVEVSWYGAVKFCNYLSEKEGLQPVYTEREKDNWEIDLDANGYRLPSEAEWEYACRAGTLTRFYWGNDPNYSLIYFHAWYPGNNNPYGTKEVRQKIPNDWELYDMSGNVWEWCNDWYDSHYYAESPSHDPTGPDTGIIRVRRGGTWNNVPWSCRSANRFGNNPEDTFNDLGFRVCRTP